MNRGMTMIEILVTLAIFALMVGLGLFMSFEAYRGASRRSERDVIVSMLERARSRAMANIDQSEWSVCYDDTEGDYVIAQGDDCPNDDRDRVEANPAVVADPNSDFAVFADPNMILFQQLTGNVVAAGSPLVITVSQNGKQEDITINYEGRINW